MVTKTDAIFSINRYLRYFDFFSFFVTLLLNCISILFVFSATYQLSNPYSIFFKKQVFGIISGYFLYFFFCFFDYRSSQRLGFILYFFVVMLLVFTIIKGSIGMGARRWINLGIIKFQPSELSKLFFPPFFAHYLSMQHDSTLQRLSSFLPMLAFIALSTILIIKQPDLGSGLLILSSSLVLLWMAGLKKNIFIMVLLFV